MKYLLLLFIILPLYPVKKDIIIAHHLLKRYNSLPLIIPDVIRDVESDEVTIITIPSHDLGERQIFCTQPRALMIGAVITASGVTCASIMTAIVTLVIHFAT